MIHISDYGINSILYQRGIYQPETFTRERKYDLTLLVTTDETLKQYMSEVIDQVKGTVRFRMPLDLLYICLDSNLQSVLSN